MLLELNSNKILGCLQATVSQIPKNEPVNDQNTQYIFQLCLTITKITINCFLQLNFVIVKHTYVPTIRRFVAYFTGSFLAKWYKVQALHVTLFELYSIENRATGNGQVE